MVVAELSRVGLLGNKISDGFEQSLAAASDLQIANKPIGCSPRWLMQGGEQIVRDRGHHAAKRPILGIESQERGERTNERRADESSAGLDGERDSEASEDF